jgi:hypothetical protein
MSNEVKWIYANTVTLEASGASAASGVIVAADDAALSSANHSNFPVADIALTCDFGAAIAAGTCIYLYRQDLNIDGTSDAPAPAAAYESLLVGIIPLPSGTSASGTYPANGDIPLSKECQFSIKNGTAQNLSAGWILKITPKTYYPG